MTVGTERGLSGRHVGRYVLDDLVAESNNTALWRATDPALQRPVGARLMPRSDPKAEALRDAARRAASVHDRGVVRVLDVVETDTHLAVITEWVLGNSWSELLSDTWSPQESATVALEVARALESAHAVGVPHGRIRPDSIMITDTSEVRLRGLGVEEVLWGCDPPDDPFRSDLHGIGSLLYVGLTKRWPDPTGRQKTVDGIEVAPLAHGTIPLPSAMVADRPGELDRVVARSVIGADNPGHLTPYANVTECIQDLDSAMSSVQSYENSGTYEEATQSRTDRVFNRMSTAAVVLFAAAGLALLIWQFLANGAADANLTQAEPIASSPALAPFESPLPEAAFPVVSVKDFDPSGDGSENPDLAPLAVDADTDSAWRTVSYLSSSMDPKTGVGLLLDLGATRPVAAVDLKLSGTGTDFEILTSKQRHGSLSDFRRMVSVTSAGDAITVRIPRPLSARYVLVWLTGLPYDEVGYTGGIADVRILG
ncbi:MAG: hypothetical protein U0990_01810 [Candidatus Nanopelagicales bacterium]|nr:hypothetical protein [Candidatus Nanopelagicales bacterium]MDZ4248804.1 hypothetical protein [Candidatus Nanopelagicales bacterium]